MGMRKKIIGGIIACFVLALTACGNANVSNSEIKKHIPKQKSEILKDALKMDEEGRLFLIENKKIESGVSQEIAFFEENLLVWGSGLDPQGRDSFNISTISLKTGEILQEKSFEKMELPVVQICDDKIALIDWGTGKILVLNDSFEVKREFATNTSYCGIYLNDDATIAYCFTKQGIRVIDMEKGDEEVLFENALLLFVGEKCGDNVSFTYTDRDTQMNECGILSLVTGKACKIPFEEAIDGCEYNDDVWLARIMGAHDRYYLGKEEAINTFASEDGAIVTMLSDPLRILSAVYDGFENPKILLKAYDLSGKFLSGIELPANISQGTGEPVWSDADNGYFFSGIDNEGHDVLLFWDFSVEGTGKDLTFESLKHDEEVTDSVIPKDLQRRAEEIGEKYGIEVVIGDRTKNEYDIYYVEQELNTEIIENALDSLEAAMKKYPDGFMNQLLYGYQRKVEIHLAGIFSVKELPTGEINGFTSYAGLEMEEPGKTIIVVDITTESIIEQTICHEIMHAVDNKLSFDAGIRENALYSEDAWMEFNPKDFVYVGDRFKLPESTFNDGYDSYFIDIYSRTNSTEDRARIMEYAMANEEWIFSENDGIYKKLEFLCKCIRDAFDTEGWPEVTEWEKML